MADMSKPQEAASWLRETVDHYRRYPSNALRHVERTAKEQRANFEACKFSGRFPGDMREDAYRTAVELLEAALPELRARAAEEVEADRVEAEKAEARRVAEEQRLAELGRKLGLRRA